ncbi:hypothetical protein E1B28_012824 [Marasmius oreades]|uniref:type I protein arginine methyltransferase n=1 Tax=Marasmius oreades TaxID=181124 RepID=A0A9P7RSE4_9AGAR|nr:uncharacterized protein E1B28_012824 [Marasmius oreades]KAG7088874.1 hypothetical protein E1B28_012824 [Marasmius oreades]
MSIRLRASPGIVLPEPEDEDDLGSVSGSECDDDDDETWEDWVSDSNPGNQPCKSLFEDKTLRSADAAVEYDKSNYGFDLNQFCSKLSLDVHGRIRLINFIRKTEPSPENVLQMNGSETCLTSDEYLKPVVEDDPLLQLQSDDWSDSEDEQANPEKRIKVLEKKLAQARAEFEAYRALVNQRFDLIEAAPDAPAAESAPKTRDDDSHYFESYGANDIHAVMIQDLVRTSTYARYILQTPTIFEGATVLDVGCGTGILSLFAARAGAKKVIAVDASDIAEKAEKIVKANELSDIITVVRGRIEDVNLPDGIQKVDVILSEWMGYALLYESMLDSVLTARRRFLRPGGVMAPSQCRMMLGLCDASEIVKERLTFWNDVYGFDLSVMAEEVLEEAIVDVVGPYTMLSDPCVVKDIYLAEITTRQLDFTSSFKLVSTVERRTKVTSFILYFDTFFTASGAPVPPDTEPQIVGVGQAQVAEVWPVGGKAPPQRRASQQLEERKMERRKTEEESGLRSKEKEKPSEVVTSFSTGPKSVPTHWKQTIFLLKEPFIVNEGESVSSVVLVWF